MCVTHRKCSKNVSCPISYLLNPISGVFQLLEEICNLGRDPKYICQKPSIQKADGTATAPPPRSNHAAEEASSEDEEEEEVQAMQSFNSTQQNETEPNQQ